MSFLTITQAARAMGVSRRHVERLIEDAQASPKTAKWKEKREFIDLSLATSKHKLIRINPDAIGNLVADPGPKDRLLEEYSLEEQFKIKKQQAQQLVYKRIKKKLWPKAKVFCCAKCENRATEYHHEDYSRWWYVEPLCRSCHVQRHWDLRKEPVQL